MKPKTLLRKISLERKNNISIVVENDREKKETTLIIGNYDLMFTDKQKVIDHVNDINELLAYWAYDNATDKWNTYKSKQTT